MKSNPSRGRLASPTRVCLALQGGGAHGAFVWGVLERLLDEEHLTFDAVCAVGNGAINAAVMAQGLMDNGRDGAKQALRQHWKRLSAASRLSPLQPTLVDRMLGGKSLAFSPAFAMLDAMTRVFSPYEFNVFDLNPLRDIVRQSVDFPRLREKSPLRLFIGATRVRDGKGAIFANRELTLDAVLASACQPFLFKSVDIDGEAYWDGGYAGNPPLAPLMEKGLTRDILLVPVHPLSSAAAPTRAAEILDRATEISFNSTLIRDMQAIAARHAAGDTDAPRAHMIDAEAILDELGRESRLNVDWDFLLYLHDAGRQAADDWLDVHGSALGKRSSLDIARVFG